MFKIIEGEGKEEEEDFFLYVVFGGKRREKTSFRVKEFLFGRVGVRGEVI